MTQDATPKHDPELCPGPWRLARSLMDGLYLFKCEFCGEERMMFVPLGTREFDPPKHST